jgi:hypothetical protein
MKAVSSAGSSGYSAPLYFQAANSSPAPYIDNVAPPGLVASPSAQSLTLSGSGFAAGLDVLFVAPGGSEYEPQQNQIAISSASTIVVSQVLAASGTWQVEVTNATGQISNLFPFTVNPMPQAPAAFTLTANAPGCYPPPSIVPLVSMSWTASAQATSYQIYRNSYPAGVVTGVLSWTDPSSLSAGQSYTYFVLASNAQGSAQSNTVTVSVPGNVCYTQPAGKILLSQSAFNTAFTQGGPPASSGLTISDDSGKPMQGTATVATQQGGNWLTLDGHPITETWYAPQTIAVTFDPTGLAPGNYSGTITVSTPQASNSPLTVPLIMQVVAPLVITSSPSLPDAFAGQPYTASLDATGGSTYSWAIQNGSLPAGLTLNASTGLISGTVGASAGTQPLNISVSDSNGRFVWQTFTLNWYPAVTISPPIAGLPQWTVGTPILNSSGYDFTVSGGTAPYLWSAAGLPPGITLSSSGVLSGTPTAAGAFQVTFTATDSGGRTGTLAITLNVVQIPLQMFNDENGGLPLCPSGVVGTPYSSAFFRATGGSQTGYQWTVSGSLPPGISSGFAPGCGSSPCDFAFFGTPTTAGVFPLNLKVTDSAGSSTSAYLVFVVNKPGPAPAISLNNLPLATFGSPYAYTFQATGGTGQLAWKIDGPLADTSLLLSPAGGLSATPSVANDCPGNRGIYLPPHYPPSRVFVVQVTDANGQADAEPICMPVFYPQPAITSIMPPYAVPDGTPQTMTIIGANFRPDSQFLFDNSVEPSTFVSDSAIQFTLYASGTQAFQTGNGGQFGPYSSYPIQINTPYAYFTSTTFAIDSPVPVIASVDADYFGQPNSPCFPNAVCDLTISGSGLTPDTVFQIVGTSQSFTYASTTSTTVPFTQITTPAYFLPSPGTYTVQATNPNTVGGGSASATATFQVYSATTMVATPSSLGRQATQGDPVATLNLGVGLAGLDRQPGTAAVSGGSWLKVNGQTTASYTTPVVLSVTLDPTGLTPATYSGSIILNSAQAQNSGLTVPVSLVVSPPLQITTTALPDAYASTPYTATLLASGGSGGGYTWALLSGSLPAGLALNSTTGVIAGTPDFTAGTVVETVQVSVQDTLGRSASQTLSLNWKQGVVIALPTAGTPQWVVGNPVLNSPGYGFTASGGTAPYQWSATGLPPGIGLSSGGVLSGTPTKAGSYSVSFSATDSAHLTGSLGISLQVTQLPLTIVDSSFGSIPPILPAGTVGVPYQTVFFNGSGGSQTGYAWAISGQLPAGISAGPPPGCVPPGCSLEFAGTPTNSGSYPISLTLTDSSSNAVSLGLTLLVTATQTIAFGTVSDKPLTAAPFTVSATASSGLAVSFNSQTAGVCTVSGTTVTLVALGTCTIQATQAGNATYAAATPVNQSFQVTLASQTITFGTLPSQSLGTAPFTVSASSSSGLAVSFNSQTTPVCTVSGATVTLVALGTCTIQATQAGNATYAAATPVNQGFQVTLASQTITFGTLSSQSLGTAPFTVSASSSSGLAVSFNSQTTGVCTVSGATVTLVAAGTCTIQATQAGNATYAAATPVNQSFQVTLVNQTITFGTLSSQSLGTAPFTVSATASSGLAVSFNSQTPPVCTVSGATVTLVAAGTCTVQGTQAGNATYAAATPVNQSFQVALVNQTITFGTLSSQSLGAAPFTVSATASSGLAVSFNSQTPPVCTISGATVTLVAVGTCTIQATQAGNASYAAATPVNQSFQVTQGSASLVTLAVANASGSPGQAVEVPIQLTTTGPASPAAFQGNLTFDQTKLTFSSARAGAQLTNAGKSLYMGTVSGGSVPLIGAGPNSNTISNGIVVYATFTFSSQFTTGSTTVALTDCVVSDPNANSLPTVCTPGTLISGSYAIAGQVTFSGSGLSGVTVALSGSGSGTSISDGSGNYSFAALPGGGSYTVTPSKSGFTFTPPSVTINSLSANQTANFAGMETQTITFGTLPSAAFGATPAVTATASSGLAVSFNSQTGAICTVAGSTVTLVTVGTCTIQATQAGNANYAPASPVSQSFAVTQASQTITFGTLSSQPFGTAPFTVGATASSGLAVSFNSQTTSVCTVSGATVTLIAAGTCTVQATQAGNANYAPASPVSQSFAVAQASQTITFGTLSSQPFGTAPFTVGATASSGLAVSFNSQTAAVCTVSGATVTLIAAGTCTVQATQAGNANYVPASPVSQSFQVTLGQTISFGTLSSRVFGTAPFTVSATASSGLTVSFNSQTTAVCTVSGATVTLVAAGTCTIQATQAGNATYAAAAPVSQSFQVTLASQTIAFGLLPNLTLNAAPFTVGATASSGLPVSFSSQTAGVCTVSGATVTLAALGACTIQATQAGNGSYAAATPVKQTFQVTQYYLCDIDQDGSTNVVDVQRIINEALGVTPASHDLNGDGVVTVADVQLVINAALGVGCMAGSKSS